MERLADSIEDLLFFAMNDRLDLDGRPLGEVSSARYDSARTELVACPYADARRGLPMNRSALRQVALHWAPVASTMRWLAGDAPTVHQAWRATIAGLLAPLTHEEPVPVVASALYKISIGLSQVTGSLLLAEEGVADAPMRSLGDTGAFFDWLDEERWLLGQVQVCAASAPMLRELYDALSGVSPPASPAPELSVHLDQALIDQATTALGVQAAFLLGVYQALRRGEDEGYTGSVAERWSSRVPPWLRSLYAAPNRPMAHALRLFPTGQVPDAVWRYVDAGPGSVAELVARLPFPTVGRSC